MTHISYCVIQQQTNEQRNHNFVWCPFFILDWEAYCFSLGVCLSQKMSAF